MSDPESPNDVTVSLWGGVARERVANDRWKLLSWDTHPVTVQHINRRISGDSNENWLHFFKRRFSPRPIEIGLSLGCGSGWLERDAVALEICNRVDAYDVAPEAISTAQAEAERQGFGDRIRYRCADLNEATLTPNRYDACFSSACLHHIVRLEYLLEQVWTALRPEGLFAVIEYVGPSRYQWDDKVERLMNRTLALLPERYRVSLRDPPAIRGDIRRPSVEEVIRADPSEAARSAEILGLLEGHFEIVYRADFGGTLLQFALADIVGNFDPDDATDRALLESLILLEETLIDEKVISSDFTFVVARRRAIAAAQRGRASLVPQQ